MPKNPTTLCGRKECYSLDWCVSDDGPGHYASPGNTQDTFSDWFPESIHYAQLTVTSDFESHRSASLNPSSHDPRRNTRRLSSKVLTVIHARQMRAERPKS